MAGGIESCPLDPVHIAPLVECGKTSPPGANHHRWTLSAKHTDGGCHLVERVVHSPGLDFASPAFEENTLENSLTALQMCMHGSLAVPRAGSAPVHI